MSQKKQDAENRTPVIRETNEPASLEERLKEQMLEFPHVDVERPFHEDIYLIRVTVNGMSYVRGIKKLCQALKSGDRLILQREPQNEYDQRAIVIKNSDRKKIGYIPRQQNQILANLMDAGKELYAKIGTIRFSEDPENDYYAIAMSVDVYMAE